MSTLPKSKLSKWKQAQDALFESEQRFKLVVESLGEGVAIVDGKEVFIFSNQAGEVIFGVESGGLVGRCLNDFLTHTQAELIHQQTELRKTGQKNRYEVEIVRPDGKTRALEVTATPWLDKNNLFIGSFAIFHDVTENRAADQRLRRSEEHYRAIIEDQTEMISRFQPNGRITFVNDAFCRFWHLSREQIIGTHQMSYVPREERPKLHAQFSSLSPACPAVTYEFRVQRWDGEFRWHQRTDRAIFDEKDQVLEYQSVSTDISEQRHAEEALKRQLSLAEMVTEISTRFINLSPQEIDAEIHQSLKKLGEFSGAERSFVILLHPDGSFLEGGFEWVSERLQPHRSLIQKGASLVSEWLLNAVRRNDIISISSLDQLPLEASSEKNQWQQFGLKSLLGLPLMAENTLLGLFGLSTERSEKEWSSEDLLMLRMIGELLINVLIRKKSVLALQDAQGQLNQRIQELEQRSREIITLSEMSNMLQIANSTEEAYIIISQSSSSLFQQTSGGLYILNPTSGWMEIKGKWGNVVIESKMSADDCWGLRRGRLYRASHAGLYCKHIPTPNTLTSTICVPITMQSKTIGLLHLQTQTAAPFQEEHQLLATAIAEQVGLALSNLQLREDLRQQAIRDQLTGLYNRYYMEASLELELNRAQRSGNPISLIMLDIDHFKEYNDHFQHQAGDRLLRTIGRLLSRSSRNGEIPCRYGGEEFLVILPGTSLSTALQRAQDIRLEVKATRSDFENQPIPPVTISLGVASCPEHGRTVNDLLKASDSAMYHAKAKGRDQVASAE